MKNQNIIYGASLALGLMAAGSVFAAETAVAEITPAKVQEQHTEQQQKMNQHRKELTKQDGQGEQHKHGEMNDQADADTSSASGKLEKNQYKHAEQTGKRSEKTEQRMTGKHERQDKVSRPAKADRPGL
jgi:hypothetical protein